MLTATEIMNRLVKSGNSDLNVVRTTDLRNVTAMLDFAFAEDDPLRIEAANELLDILDCVSSVFSPEVVLVASSHLFSRLPFPEEASTDIVIFCNIPRHAITDWRYQVNKRDGSDLAGEIARRAAIANADGRTDDRVPLLKLARYSQTVGPYGTTFDILPPANEHLELCASEMMKMLSPQNDSAGHYGASRMIVVEK